MKENSTEEKKTNCKDKLDLFQRKFHTKFYFVRFIDCNLNYL